MALDQIVEPPSEIDIMKCFAFDRDVTKLRPHLMWKLDFKSLPYRSPTELSYNLRKIGWAGIAEDSMVVNDGN